MCILDHWLIHYFDVIFWWLSNGAIEIHWKLATRGLNLVTVAIPHSRQKRCVKIEKKPGRKRYVFSFCLHEYSHILWEVFLLGIYFNVQVGHYLIKISSYSFRDGFFATIPSLAFAVLAAAYPSYPSGTAVFLCTLSTFAWIWKVFLFWDDHFWD